MTGENTRKSSNKYTEADRQIYFTYAHAYAHANANSSANAHTLAHTRSSAR